MLPVGSLLLVRAGWAGVCGQGKGKGGFEASLSLLGGSSPPTLPLVEKGGGWKCNGPDKTLNLGKLIYLSFEWLLVQRILSLLTHLVPVLTKHSPLNLT